jgi:1,4-dihydroxy-2-naphthoate octaprenyltransferase
MVTGTYWVIAGQPGWIPLIISIPVGLMVASILFYQSLPESSTEPETGFYSISTVNMCG